MKHLSLENKGNDHQLKNLLMVKTNSTYQLLSNCLEYSINNLMHTDFLMKTASYPEGLK